MSTDWSFLGFELATRGIASDVIEDVTDDYEPDPWRPKPNTDAVVVTLDRDGATQLAELIALERIDTTPTTEQTILEGPGFGLPVEPIDP